MGLKDRQTLSHKVGLLKTWAVQQGMEEKEVQACIARALSVKIVKEKPKGTKRLRQALGKVVWAALAVLAAGVVARCGLELAMRSHVFGPALRNLSFVKVMRLCRKATLPLHSPPFNISYYNHQDCMLANPMYERRVVRCATCQHVTGFKKPREDRPLSIPHLRAFPLVFKSALPASVSLGDIQTLVRQHRQVLDIPTMQYRSTSQWARSVLDLGGSDVDKLIREDPGFVFQWTSHSVPVGRLLRRLFPRTLVLPPGVEFSVSKTVLLTAPTAATTLKSFKPTPVVYMQGGGSRNLSLVPNPSCSLMCSPLSVLLHPTDIAIFNSEFYIASIGPGEDNNDVSIAQLVHLQ